MNHSFKSIPVDCLFADIHNPNIMSKTNFLKLLRNIGFSGLYEPLIVRPIGKKDDKYQIINGYHRAKALVELGYRNIDCVVWCVDDFQKNIQLLTLNRLCGKDDLMKKIKILEKVTIKGNLARIARYLVQTETQIRRILDLKLKIVKPGKGGKHLLNTLVFFVTDEQKATIEKALNRLSDDKKAKTSQKGTALAKMAQFYLERA